MGSKDFKYQIVDRGDMLRQSSLLCGFSSSVSKSMAAVIG